MADALIYNPASAGGRGLQRAQKAQRALAARGVSTDLLCTRAPGDAALLARRLAEEGATRLLAVGGDGTLSDVADGVLRSARRVDLGFLPGGTGNDFLGEFGVTSIDAAAQRIAAGQARNVDAMRVCWAGGERHAITVAGIGFMARVAAYANRRLKRFGALGYKMAVLPEAMRLRAPVTRVSLDGRIVEEPFCLVAACNTRFAGGGMRFAPMASPQDGVLEVIALRRVGRWALTTRLLPLLLRGAHIGDPDVFHATARHVLMEPADPSPLLSDGEVLGESPVSIEALPGALRVFV